MGPRACSILGSKGRFFAYGIRRENNDMDLISKQASKHASTQTSKQTSKQARGQGNHRWLSCPRHFLEQLFQEASSSKQAQTEANTN